MNRPLLVGAFLFTGPQEDLPMVNKPTYEELAQRVQELEKKDLEHNRKENGFFSSILEFLPHPIYVIDASNYRITAVNSAAQINLLSNDSTCYALMHNRDTLCNSAGHPCPVEKVKRTKQPVTVEHIHYDADGNPRNIEVSAYPIFDDEGNVSQIVKYDIDITELKQMEETLRKSEQQHRMLVETMNEGFSMVDENQMRIYANKRLCEMLGYEYDDIVGVPATKLLDESNKKRFEEQFVKRKKGETGAYEITFTRKDGHKVPAIVSPRPVFDEKGNFKGSFSVITDVTDLKRTQEALKHREQELEMQTANLEEANAALKVLLKRRDEDKKELEEKVLFNMGELVEPYLEKLRKTGLDERQKAFLDILGSNLNEIISPFSRTLYFSYLNLTPSEMQIAALIRRGRTTKEIASVLNLSSRTVETHRKNIRKKLGLTDKKANLRTKLLSLQ
jgi:PAS domain S-box-containing protein